MNKQVWTEQDIDNLILSVEETLEKAEVLAKSTADGDPDPKDDNGAPPDPSAPPADASAAPADPAADPAAAAAPADPSAAPADGQPAPAEGAADPAAGDQSLAAEGQEDQPLSDEELSQIYSSMPPEELERHYSIIRQALQASMTADQGAAPADPASAAPPAPAAPAPDAGAAMPPGMEKSENSVIAALQKQVTEQAEALAHVTKAFEVLAKPSRKSITDIQFMAKSDADPGQPGQNGTRPMSRDEVKAEARKLQPGSLTKHERDMVNSFYISGDGQAEIEKLIHSKGGK